MTSIYLVLSNKATVVKYSISKSDLCPRGNSTCRPWIPTINPTHLFPLPFPSSQPPYPDSINIEKV